MFTFHHKSTILDISRYDCLAFTNPEESDRDIVFDKVFIDTTYPLNVQILAMPSDFEGYKENSLSDQVKSNVVGREVYSVVEIYGHPQAGEDAEVVKEVLVDEPANIIESEDYLILKPGNALIFRAKPKAINTEVNITINYLED